MKRKQWSISSDITPQYAQEVLNHIESTEAECERQQKAAETWQRRYQELVDEPLPRLLWRRTLVQVARLLGGRR